MYGAHVRAAFTYIKVNTLGIKISILPSVFVAWHTCVNGYYTPNDNLTYCGPLPIVGRGACAFMILFKFRKLNGECAARIEGEGVQRGLEL